MKVTEELVLDSVACRFKFGKLCLIAASSAESLSIPWHAGLLVATSGQRELPGKRRARRAMPEFA